MVRWGPMVALFALITPIALNALIALFIYVDSLKSIGVHWLHWDPLGSIEIHWDPLGYITIHWDPLQSIRIK